MINTMMASEEVHFGLCLATVRMNTKMMSEEKNI
jgi:hypothetical protein